MPNFMHLDAERVSKRRFLGSLFEAISSLVAKVRMKLPQRRQHRFRGFRAPKQRWISTLFSEGVRGSSGVAFFYAFDDFGCPPGFKREPFWSSRAFFLRSEISMIFELENRGARERPALFRIPGAPFS